MVRRMEERGGMEERHREGELEEPGPGRLDLKRQPWGGGTGAARNAVKTVTGRVMLNLRGCALRYLSIRLEPSTDWRGLSWLTRLSPTALRTHTHSVTIT